MVMKKISLKLRHIIIKYTAAGFHNGSGGIFLVFFIFFASTHIDNSKPTKYTESNRKEDRDSVRNGKTIYYRRTEMDFFQTQMGKAFYMGTMPRLCKAIEDLNNKLDRSINVPSGTDASLPSSIFEWANFKTDDAMLKKATEVVSFQGSEENFTTLIVSEIISDSDRSASRLIEDYRSASIEERRAIDGIFVDLTGWSFGTLVKKYLDMVKVQSKEER